MITLVLPYPCSANRYWATRIISPKGGGRQMAMTYVTPEAKAYKDDVAWRVKAAGIRKPIEGRVAVAIRLYPNRPQDFKLRQRKLGIRWDDSVQCIDLGNCEKVLSDALKDLVFGDDKWLWDIHLTRHEPDEHGARVVVIVKPIELQEPQTGLDLDLPTPAAPAPSPSKPDFPDVPF